MSIEWEKSAEEMFNKVLDNLPQFHRNIAKQLVRQKSEELAVSRGSKEVQQADLVAAFFQEVPPAFRDMMKRLLTHLGIDYSACVKDEASSARDCN